MTIINNSSATGLPDPLPMACVTNLVTKADECSRELNLRLNLDSMETFDDSPSPVSDLRYVKAFPADIKTVDFNGDLLTLIVFDENVYVPIKPITDGMGINYQGQVTKLYKHDKDFVYYVNIEANSKKALLCLPLWRINIWLKGISVKKSSFSALKKILAYQSGCEGVLLAAYADNTNVVATTVSTDVPISLEAEIGAGAVAEPKAKRAKREVVPSITDAALVRLEEKLNTLIDLLQKQVTAVVPPMSYMPSVAPVSPQRFHTLKSFARICEIGLSASDLKTMEWDCAFMADRYSKPVITIIENNEIRSAYLINTLLLVFRAKYPRIDFDQLLVSL
jgi:hypothetical protein